MLACVAQKEPHGSGSGTRGGRGSRGSGKAAAGRQHRGRQGRGGRGALADEDEDDEDAYEDKRGAAHPARLLDRDDPRHYSGFLGQLSPSEELSMDVPDLLASLLELGGAPPNQAAKPSPAPSGAAAAAGGRGREQHHRSGPPASGGSRGEQQWGVDSAHSAEPGSARRGGRGSRHAAVRMHAHVEGASGSGAQQWDGREQAWDGPPGMLGSSGRRGGNDSGSGSLPLHEVWMQHEGDWAQIHGMRQPLNAQVRSSLPNLGFQLLFLGCGALISPDSLEHACTSARPDTDAIVQDGLRKSNGEALAWGDASLRTLRQARAGRVAWPTCLHPLVSPHAHGAAPQAHQLPAPTHPSRLAPPSLWKSPVTPPRERKQARAWITLPSPFLIVLVILGGPLLWGRAPFA